METFIQRPIKKTTQNGLIQYNSVFDLCPVKMLVRCYPNLVFNRI